jgi:transposase-like protein
MKMRKKYSAEFKARVAMEALLEQNTLSEIASGYGVHPTQMAHWKKELQERAVEISGKKAQDAKAAETREAELYRQIGQLKVEVDWLKKKSAEMLRG